MKFISRILVVVLMLGLSSCEMFQVDLLENPNRVAPEKAEINFLYNNIQLTFRNFVNSTHYFGASTTRLVAMTSGFTYNNAFSPTSFNGVWNTAYSQLLPDIEALLAIADERSLTIHGGSAKIMKAYTLMTLVDMFKDVPYSEALKGTDIISPKVDEGSTIYAAAEALLDEAIADLGVEAAAPAEDNFYGGDPAKWITLANTLKMKLYLTTRLVDGSAIGKFEAIVNAGDYIDEAGEDFEFKYGNTRANPNSRHPFYNNSYENNDGAYQSNYFMWALNEGNVEGMQDPRIRFYFYRQDGDLSNEDPNIWECIFSTEPDPASSPDHYSDEMPYCIASINGYFGRDHGNAAGIPPDGPVRAVYGLYPAGGNFDDNGFDFTQNQGTDGILGEGIAPIMLSSWVDFMRAEIALVSGGDARAHLESGMEKSMDKVFSFADKINTSKVVASDPVTGDDITLQQAYLDNIEEDAQAYRDAVLALYDAGDDDEKLNIIMKQYMVALYGNGIENYNNYRRTGKPDNLQPTIEPASGNFIYSAIYPTVFVTLNANVEQKSNQDRVFWDNNSFELK